MKNENKLLIKSLFAGLCVTALITVSIFFTFNNEYAQATGSALRNFFITDADNLYTARVGLEKGLSVQNFNLEVARGKVSGFSFDRKFGSINGLVLGTPVNVWEYGSTSGAEIYTFSTTADIDTLSSSSGSDTEEITIIGLDTDYIEVTQTKDLTGQTKATLDTPLLRVNRMYNSNGVDLVGDVYLYVDGAITTGVPNVVTTVRAFISAGQNQTLQAIYTVPAGKTAYFMGLETSMTHAGNKTDIVGVNCIGKTRDFGKAFRIRDEFDLISTGSSNRVYNMPVPLPFAEKTDFITLVETNVTGGGASWAFTVMLVDN